MNRIDRLMALLITLQSKKFVSAEAIAERYSTSIRTVYRDIKALSETGVPIGFENGKGYFIMPGYFVPPVSFTPEEANAMILMDAIAHRFTDRSIQKHYRSAVEKVSSVLKTGQRDKTDFLRMQIMASRPTCLDNNFEYLSEIQNSISNRVILKMEYQNYEEKFSVREIEPIGMVFYSMNWHVMAWCWERKEYRDFRLSRIRKLISTGKEYRKKDHPELDEYMKTFSIP